MGRAILAISGSAAGYLPRPLVGIASALGGYWRDLFHTMFGTYRPERHYMRGPGPAYRAKYGEPLY